MLNESAVESCARDGLIRWDGQTWRSTPAGDCYLDRWLRTVPSQLAILDVMIAYPSLSIEGLDDPRRLGFVAACAKLGEAVEQFDAAVAWLQLVPRTLQPRQFSYILKHRAQSWSGKYVSNGALIAAALHLGIRVRREPGTLNAYLAIGGRKSWPRQK